MEQRALEEFVGASTQEAVSPDTNRYLFSSTGSVDSVGFVRISRLVLMLMASGTALAVALPFVYLPVLRQPAVFVVVGVMLLASAIAYPEHSVMLGQAAAIGLGLAVVASALADGAAAGAAAASSARVAFGMSSDRRIAATDSLEIMKPPQRGGLIVM